MKLGIMQPYFLPYIGYFALIQYVDTFIFFDTAQYISHGWVNRNRILKQGGGVTYITVPVTKAPRETPIKDIRINMGSKWEKTILGQLSFYKRKAPYYQQTIDLLRGVFDSESISLARLNINGIKSVLDFLGIQRDIRVYSDMNLSIDEVNAPDEWALNITKAMSYSTYVNAPGGMSFFHREKYSNNQIRLEFLQSEVVPYVQRIGYFEPGLSIVDILMFCSVEEIKDMLLQYKIL